MAEGTVRLFEASGRKAASKRAQAAKNRSGSRPCSLNTRPVSQSVYRLVVVSELNIAMFPLRNPWTLGEKVVVRFIELGHAR